MFVTQHCLSSGGAIQLCTTATEFNSSVCPLETEWQVAGGVEEVFPLAMLVALTRTPLWSGGTLSGMLIPFREMSSLWVSGKLPGSSGEDGEYEVCGEVGDLGEETRRDFDRFPQHSQLFHCCLTREGRTT